MAFVALCLAEHASVNKYIKLLINKWNLQSYYVYTVSFFKSWGLFFNAISCMEPPKMFVVFLLSKSKNTIE